MTELIKTQAFDVATMLACGVVLAALGQLLRWYQKKRKPRKLTAFLQDLLYWFLSALLAAAFLYYCAYGRLSLHALLSVAAGAAGWTFYLGKKITNFCCVFYDIMFSRCRGTKSHQEGK